MQFISDLFDCFKYDSKKSCLNASEIIFFALAILMPESSFSLTCESLLSADSQIIHVNFSNTSLRGRMSDHDDLDSLKIFDDDRIIENLLNASESYVQSKSFKSKKYFDLDTININFRSTIKRRFTRDHVLEFLEIISPIDKQIFIQKVFPFEPGEYLDSALKDLQNRFILYMVHDWSLESPVLLTSEIGINRINRFIFSKVSALSGFSYTSQGLKGLENSLFTFLKHLNKRIVLTESHKNAIFDAYLRVMTFRSHTLPLETWFLNHDTGDIQLGIAQIELDFLIFFKFIGFTDKRDINYLVRIAFENPSVLRLVYDLIYSTLMFYNSIGVSDSDFMVWSRDPVEQRIWTPNRVKSTFKNLSMYNLRGIEFHSPHFVKAVKEILHRLIFAIKNRSHTHEFIDTDKLLKDEFYFKTFKTLQVVAIHSQNKELFDRILLDLREAVVLSLSASLDPELVGYLSNLSSSLIDKGRNDSPEEYQQRLIDDFESYNKLSEGFKSFIDQQNPDQDWLNSYYELIKFSL